MSAAHVSMATAADIGRNIADLVFLPDSLEAVSLAIGVCERAGRLIRQNIGPAIVYNVIAVPVVVPGHVTPLNTVIAMSGSSLLIVANTLRLLRTGKAMIAARPARALVMSRYSEGGAA